MDKQAVQFFVKNAGYSYNPKTETPAQGRKHGAQMLAIAEKAAEIAGATYEWEYDQDMPIEDMLDSSVFGTPEEFAAYCDKYRDDVLMVCLKDGNGEPRASLCGIIGATREYKRVVEAELALEAFGQEFFIS